MKNDFHSIIQTKNMNWQTAENNLNNIRPNQDLDEKVSYKIVRDIPHNRPDGFRVQVGKDEHIDIPLDMLRKIFERSVSNGGRYNREVINALYPQKVKSKPCYVQSVGKLFKAAGVMDLVPGSQRNYKINY